MSKAAASAPRLAALLMVAAAWTVLAEEPPRPRVGLALGGGSARGLAHVGVLEVLEEHGIPIDVIAGTSMGACVGALYASGHSATEVGAIARGIGWERIFRGRSERRLEPVAWRVDDVPAVVSAGVRGRRLLAPSAALSDYRISRLLIEHLAAAGVRAKGDFARLPTPFRAVATDLRTGERVVLERGDLPRAVRASMSLPVVFPPVELDGRLLVDGALSDNVPSGLAREMGADVVVAVSVGAPPRELDQDADVLEVVGRLTELMMTRGNDAAEQPPDVLIRPALDGIDADDFSLYDAAIAAGRAAALAAVPEIERRLGDRPRGSRKGLEEVDAPRGTVTAIRVKGAQAVGENLIRRRLGIEEGDPLDMAAALRGLDSLWASNLFSGAWLEIGGDGGAGLTLTARVRERPSTRVGLGVAYNEADNLRGFLRFRHGNLLGQGERLDLVARFDSSLAAFDAAFGSAALGGAAVGYRVGVRVSEEKPLVYDSEGERLDRARFRHDAVAASVHRVIRDSVLIDLGFMAGRSESFERVGVPFAPHAETVVRATGRVVADTLDDRFFPGRGVRLDARGDQALPGLGASLDYGRAWGRLDAFTPLGRLGVLELRAFAGASRGSVPEYDLFRVGGPELVPGRARDELWGSRAGAASLALCVRVGRSARLYVRGGAGNAWSEEEAVSLGDLRAGAGAGIAYNTRLGPALIELGMGAGRLRVYVSLGFQ